jgi:hypothetical protein
MGSKGSPSSTLAILMLSSNTTFSFQDYFWIKTVSVIFVFKQCLIQWRTIACANGPLAKTDEDFLVLPIQTADGGF